MRRIKKLLTLMMHSSYGFVHDNAFKLSAALSYYTVFALAPLLIVIISLSGIFFGRDAVRGKVYAQLHDLVGVTAAVQIQEILKNIQLTQYTTTGAIIGGIALFIGATGVFTEMQDSINFIWSVKAKPKKSWLKFLINRFLSFSLVVALGFVMLVSLVLNALLNLLSNKLMQLFPGYTIDLFQAMNAFISLLVITTLFTLVFKVLPDAIISWRDAFMGALITALLFQVGKFLIGYFLGKANIGMTYGTAAAIIIILLWVYYSAMILYWGAEFAKMYALQAGEGIRPKQTAVFIIKQESKEIPMSSLDT